MAILSDAIIAAIVIVVIIVIAAIVIPIVLIYGFPPKKKELSFFEWSTIEGSGALAGEYIPAYYGDLGILDLWNQGYKGQNIKILLIDTGVNSTHPDLINVIDANVNVDEVGHGTGVAGVIAGEINGLAMVGSSPLAVLYSYDFGDGSIQNVINGIAWGITNGVDVISMSFGTTSNFTALHAIIQQARTAGIYLIAAAGNSSASTYDFPARYSECIPVASVSANGSLSSFSNYDPSNTNTVSMYGEFIVTDNAFWVETGDLLVYYSGTSLSTPFVSGLCALMLQKTLAEGGSRPTLSQMATLLKQHLPANPA